MQQNYLREAWQVLSTGSHTPLSAEGLFKGNVSYRSLFIWTDLSFMAVSDMDFRDNFPISDCDSQTIKSKAVDPQWNPAYVYRPRCLTVQSITVQSEPEASPATARLLPIQLVWRQTVVLIAYSAPGRVLEVRIGRYNVRQSW